MTNKPEDVFRYINMHGGDTTVCWEWLRGLNDKGRAYYTIDGRKQLVYRLAYTLVFGDIPDGQLLRHTCDHEWCCNPYHVVPGTHEENMNDMKTRERHGLSHHVVRAIRKLLTSGRTQQEIAELYGVSRETISAIETRRVYDHVTDNDDKD